MEKSAGENYDSAKVRTEELVETTQSPDEVVELYNNWTNTYDQDLPSEVYKAPELAAQYLADQNINKEDRILDIASGTGLVAVQLRDKYGYTNVDALDACKDMLEYSRQANLYKNYYWTRIGGGDKAPFLDNTYHNVTMAGGIAPGHVPVDAISEMIRITKPGGYIVITTRNDHRYKLPEYQNLDATLQEYQNKGFWEKVKEAVTPKYFLEYDGVTWVFKVTKHIERETRK